ncbi:MAG: hypothetical protein ABR902_17680 [Candidatus Korobacteraceae bacterium]
MVGIFHHGNTEDTERSRKKIKKEDQERRSRKKIKKEDQERRSRKKIKKEDKENQGKSQKREPKPDDHFSLFLSRLSFRVFRASVVNTL